MESTNVGDRVKVATEGPVLDGIVFDLPSDSKAVVAVIDRARGPVLRPVPRSRLSERTEEGPDDRALELLIRRTPPPSHGHGRPGNGGQQGRSGFSRATGHRTTGK
ncbi:MAG: hypothetical protein HZB46_18510 [Solirubrobacterales bacterium]|nr:hypothetical protein [Solirubrobacterales bacterium]